jgi:hypothetical protein
LSIIETNRYETKSSVSTSSETVQGTREMDAGAFELKKGVYLPLTCLAEFIPLFINRLEWLLVLLEYVVFTRRHYQSVAVNTLLELYLREDVRTVVPSEQDGCSVYTLKERHRELVMSLLRNPEVSYDWDHALMLCQVHRFREGVVYLLEKEKQ